MDSTVAGVLTTQLTTFKTDTLTTFAAIIPIAMIVLITITLVRKGVKWFRGLAKLGK
jgi:hypothetical protein